MADKHPFQPGVKVALVTRNSGEIVDVKQAVVGKVRKNGNFVLDGASQQYRARLRFRDKMWEGFAVSGGSYYDPHVEMMTDALKEEVAKARRIRRFKAMQAAFERLRCPDGVTDAELNALQAAIDAFAPPKGVTT